MKQSIFLAFILIFSICCTPEKEEAEIVEDTIEIQEDVTISSIGITLTPKAKDAIASWEDYQLVATKMERYNKVTKTEALLNARELSALIKTASDTIDVKKLDRPDVKMRFNVLYNHAFRLEDMERITSITQEEVMDEVTMLLNAFSALNDKINVIYMIEEYEEELDILSDNTVKFDDAIEADESGKITQKKKPIDKRPTMIDAAVMPSNEKKKKTKAFKNFKSVDEKSKD